MTNRDLQHAKIHLAILAAFDQAFDDSGDAAATTQTRRDKSPLVGNTAAAGLLTLVLRRAEWSGREYDGFRQNAG